MEEPVNEGLTFEKVRAMFQETRTQMKESRETMEETNRRLKEEMEETDRLLKEVAEQQKETSRIVEDLGNNFGRLPEYLVMPNMVEKFDALGYEVERAGRNTVLHGPDKKILTEIDILLENGEFVIVVEVKSDLTETHVKLHEERMQKLRRYWDERGDRRRLVGAVAGASMEEKVKAFAFKMGFYVIVQSGDTVKIEAPEGFTPKLW
jgi:hypothetical protein